MLKKKSLIRSILVIILGAMLWTVQPTEAWAGYTSTCQDINITGSELSAKCDNKIDLNEYISNDDGYLKWNPSGWFESGGGFIQSCSQCELSDGGKTMYCLCNTRDGGNTYTKSIDLDKHIYAGSLKTQN